MLIAVGLFIRLRIDDPPSFKTIRETGQQAKMPMVEVLREHPKTTLLAMGARISESVTFNVYNAFLLTYTTLVLGLPNSVALQGLLIAAVVGFFVIPLAGHLSDRVGRKPVYLAGALLAAVSAFPIFWAIDTENTALIWVAVVVGWGLAACTMYGPQASFFAELYPTRVRYSGMSIVYQIGVLPSGAIAPLVAVTLVGQSDGASWPVALYVLTMAAITIVSLWFSPETFRRDINATVQPGPIDDLPGKEARA